MTRRPAALAVPAAIALACAHAARGGGPPFTFPTTFDANQAVTVWRSGDTRELLASLRWRGGDLEVTLFDPSFAVPLIHATRRAGAVRIEAFHGGAAEEAARRLVELLGELYAEAFHETAPDGAEARSPQYAFRIEGVRTQGGCAFPQVIEVALRADADVRVRVITLDLSCPADAPLGD